MCLNPLRFTNSSNSELEKADPISGKKMSGRPWVENTERRNLTACCDEGLATIPTSNHLVLASTRIINCPEMGQQNPRVVWTKGKKEIPKDVKVQVLETCGG